MLSCRKFLTKLYEDVIGSPVLNYDMSVERKIEL